jgi:hypothetical protein
MPSFEQVELFFLEFSREMRDQGLFLMDDYQNDWPGLLTEDEIRDQQVEEQYVTDESEED